MMNSTGLKGYFGRPGALVLIYALAVVLLACVTVASLADIVHRYSQRNDSIAMLENLKARAHAFSKNDGAPEPDLPFLSGSSPTIAGAMLLQRVTSAINRSGGSILSSEVGEKAAKTGERELKTIVHFQIGQVDLQKLLYHLEAGVPFLFVDQLDLQSKQSTEPAAPLLHVVMEVSGIWRGRK